MDQRTPCRCVVASAGASCYLYVLGTSEGVFVGYRKVRGGSKMEEFERLYRETFSSIFNYLYYHTLNRETAEDLASTVYLKAYRSFDRFDPSRASFSVEKTAREIGVVLPFVSSMSKTTCLPSASASSSAN